MSDMRRLWTDHVVWTRQVIVSTIGRLPDAPVALSRLMRNQVEIGAAARSPQLGELLREHIAISVRLVAAVIRGDSAAVASEDKAWHANADQIARLLGGGDPAKTEAMRRMLYEHLLLTTKEVAARVKGDWNAVAAFDAVLTQALHMADALSK